MKTIKTLSFSLIFGVIALSACQERAPFEELKGFITDLRQLNQFCRVTDLKGRHWTRQNSDPQKACEEAFEACSTYHHDRNENLFCEKIAFRYGK